MFGKNRAPVLIFIFLVQLAAQLTVIMAVSSMWKDEDHLSEPEHQILINTLYPANTQVHPHVMPDSNGKFEERVSTKAKKGKIFGISYH